MGDRKFRLGPGLKYWVLSSSCPWLASLHPQRAEAQTTISICNRTPQIEAKILEALSKTEADCGSVTATELAGITILEVRGDKSLTALKAGDFDNLTGLTKLGLFNNNLSSLPVGVFDSLTSLKQLSLPDNNLSSLPSGIFDKLTSLERLWFHANNVSSLPSGMFDSLTSLTQLSFRGSKLSSLPSGIFDKLTSLEFLSLYDSKLSSLPSGIFDKLTKLKWLFLHNNKLTSLPMGIFDKVTKLQVLNLEGNNLRTLSVGVFDKLTSVKWVMLRRNFLLNCQPSVPSSVITLFLNPSQYQLAHCDPGVTITESGGATRVSEGVEGRAANTDTYTVVLNNKPRASVTIAITSGDTGAATVSPASLTFTPPHLEHCADGDSDRGGGRCGGPEQRP